MRKYLICSLIGLILGLCSSWIYLTYDDEVLIKNNKEVEFNSEVYISDFIYRIDGSLIDNKKIDTTKMGINTVKYTYINNYGWIKSSTFDINVIDTTSPIILLGDTYTVEVGYDKKLEDVILCADEVDDEIDCWIEGNYNLGELGSYKLEMFAKDKSNNINSKEFTLNVIKHKNNSYSNTYTDYKEIYSKYKKDNTLIGLDVSKWQGEIDFKTLKENNVEFVMIKLAGQKEIDGEIEIDPYFYKNIENAIDNNIKVGVYFYSYAKSSKEAEGQARYVINELKQYNIDMPIAFDWENFSTYNSFDLSIFKLNNIAKSFINKIEDRGYKGILYSSKYYLENIWYNSDYKIWLANYSNTFYEGDYIMWQLCSDGIVDGIDGYVDIDIYYKE